MSIIRYINTDSNSLNNIVIITGQIIECIDTKEIYIDDNNCNRIKTEDIIIVPDEFTREGIVKPDQNKKYLTVDTEHLYKYKFGWIKLSDEVILSTGSISLTQAVLTTNDGNHIAPETLASCVYMDDGTPVEDILNQMIVGNKRFELITKTESYIVELGGQKIFRIAIPFAGYNFNIFPMVVLINDKCINKNKYVVTEDGEIIFSQNLLLDISVGDIITYIFSYYKVITEDNLIDADFINGVRYFTSGIEPYLRQNGDIWFDTTLCSIKQFDGSKWNIIASGEDKLNGGFICRQFSFDLKENSNYIDIGVDFRKGKDLLIVFKNGVYLHESDDYDLSVDGKKILCSVTDIWTGSKESPMVFNFLVFVNVPTSDVGINGNLIDKDSVQYESLSEGVKSKLKALDLSSYYNKVDVDKIITELPNKSVDLSGLYTKEETYSSKEIDGKLIVTDNKISKIVTDLNEKHYTSADIDIKISSIGTNISNIVKNISQLYATKDELSTIIKDLKLNMSVETSNNIDIELDKKILDLNIESIISEKVAAVNNSITSINKLISENTNSITNCTNIVDKIYKNNYLTKESLDNYKGGVIGINELKEIFILNGLPWK